METKLSQPEEKQIGFTARMAVLFAATVCIICTAFLLFNHLLVNQRISALEEKLEELQRRGIPNVNVSLLSHETKARVTRSLEDGVRKEATDQDFQGRMEDASKKGCVCNLLVLS